MQETVVPAFFPPSFDCMTQDFGRAGQERTESRPHAPVTVFVFGIIVST
jgi:hypothetical protein